MRPLAVIGNVNVDLILGPADPWPKAGTEVMVDHDELRVGGQAGNSALAWDGMGIEYEIAANVGDDQFGRWLADAFTEKHERNVEPGSAQHTVSPKRHHAPAAAPQSLR